MTSNESNSSTFKPVLKEPYICHNYHEYNTTKKWIILKRKNDKRLLCLNPFFSVKISIDKKEKKWLSREWQSNKNARTVEFWKDLVMPFNRVAPGIYYSLKGEIPTIDDYHNIEQTIHSKIYEAKRIEKTSVLDLSLNIPFFTQITSERLNMVISEHFLPLTGMHGDFHMYNIVKYKNKIKLIDWEHYNPYGSFVFDYLNFYTSQMRWKSGLSWPEYYMQIIKGNPAFEVVSDLFNIKMEILVFYYSLVRANIMMQRRDVVSKKIISTISLLAKKLQR